jgi:hypothetical protein
MNAHPENADASLPDPSALATLAAQARFIGLPPETAAEAALDLWRRCRTVLDDESESEALRARALEIDGGAFPQPAKFPAAYEDFYRLIVKSKDKGGSQVLVKDWLVAEERNSRAGVAGSEPSLTTQEDALEKREKLLANWKALFTEERVFRQEWDNMAARFRRYSNNRSLTGKRRGGRASQAAQSKKNENRKATNGKNRKQNL